MADKQKNLVHNPTFSGISSLEEWSFSSPRSEIALGCQWDKSSGGNSLRLLATGDRNAFGCWKGKVDLKIGKWYKASVRVKMQKIAEPYLSILARVGKHLLLPKSTSENEICLEQVFQIGTEYEGDEIELFLRSAATGQVEWFDPKVIEIDPPTPRMVRVPTVRFGMPDSKLTIEMQQNRIIEKMRMAGALRPDITVLTEFSNIAGMDLKEIKSYKDVAESVPDGPTCKIISAAAKQFNMYVIAGIIEIRDKYLYNTAVIFDRHGNFVGQYDKTHLTIYELTEGFSCGQDYPVFDLDFGKIGVLICYDEWFPEVSRYYAYKGAEILFLPVMGGKPMVWRTRALDNGLYLVSSSHNPPSMIIDSSGAIIAETHGDGIACADLNLDYRKTNAYGDPTLSYGMPLTMPQMRNVIDDKLISDLAGLMRGGQS